jgi:hypothetical protein
MEKLHKKIIDSSKQVISGPSQNSFIESWSNCFIIIFLVL